MAVLEDLTEAIEHGDRSAAVRLTRDAVDAGIAPATVLDSMTAAMEEIGRLFQNNEVFVLEMLIAARAMQESTALLEPLLVEAGVQPEHTAIFGTVRGDLHDIGKNLVGMMYVDLEAGMMTVRHTLQISTRALADPKTERGRRLLRLPAQVLDALRERRRAQLAGRFLAGSRWADLDHVFATRQGRPLMARNVLRAFHGLLQRAGLPRQPFHHLRHA